MTLVKKDAENGQLPGSFYPGWLLWHLLGRGLNWNDLKRQLPPQQFSPQKLLPCWNNSWVPYVISLSILSYKLQQFRKWFTTCSANLTSEAVIFKWTGQVNVVVVPVNLLDLSQQTSGLFFLLTVTLFFFPVLSSRTPVPLQNPGNT